MLKKLFCTLQRRATGLLRQPWEQSLKLIETAPELWKSSYGGMAEDMPGG
jgi:hypothetical protein|nr:MAG TPA: hypothetical protein [Caudoviricetes sp.]